MIRSWLRRRLLWPPLGRVDFGALRRFSPVGDCTPGSSDALDRRLAEEFLADHGADIAGRVLLLGGADMTLRHGGGRVRAFIPHDVRESALDLPDELHDFDCILASGMLGRILAPQALLRELRARLRRGGVLLATLPGAAHYTTDDDACWRFTPYAARLLFAAVFGDNAISLATRGNVLVATAHAHRLPAAALGAAALSVDDAAAFPFMIGVRAVRVDG